MTKTPRLGPRLVPSLLVNDLEATFICYERQGSSGAARFPKTRPFGVR